MHNFYHKIPYQAIAKACFKSLFFPNAESELLSINFSESERNELLNLFNPEKTSFGEIGLSKNLKKDTKFNHKGIDFEYLLYYAHFHPLQVVQFDRPIQHGFWAESDYRNAKPNYQIFR
ncbi:hypothetical protein ACG2LH_12575 [Zhouia sp. PK063]|uniref:hypothetical protein n=1 Tax=Zhouia sp. PK063 TaxID=3373602 RepID=UPI0037AEBDCA